MASRTITLSDDEAALVIEALTKASENLMKEGARESRLRGMELKRDALELDALIHRIRIA